MNYIIEANIGIVFLYGAYLLLLRNETDFRHQRLFLVGALFCALLFPLISIGSLAADELITTIVLPEIVVGTQPVITSSSSVDLLFVGYIVVALIIATPLLVHSSRIYRTLKKANGQYHGDYFVIESADNKPSWSFFKVIYIGRSGELTSEEKDLVMKHEMLHGRLYHSADMLFVTILCIVFWFNPVVWFYRRTLAKVHEFQVDAIVTDQFGVVSYSVLLAKTALSGNGFLLTHHFNQSFILKRINMINMIKSRISNWKLAALGMAVGLCLTGVACTEQISEKNDTTALNGTPTNVTDELARLKKRYPGSSFDIKEVDMNKPLENVKVGESLVFLMTMPTQSKAWLITEKKPKDGEIFTIVEQTAEPVPGIKAFYEQLGHALQYPDEARRKGIEGKVFVEFVINEDGRLSDFKVLKGISDECDTEAMRAIMQLGDWLPASQEGKKVTQRMVLPITFKLN